MPNEVSITDNIEGMTCRTTGNVRTPSRDGVRIGIVGCGALGSVHAGRFAAIPGVTVDALADPQDTNTARIAGEIEAAGQRESPRQFADYRDLLDCGLDSVCIASPDGFHVPQVLDALAAGLHVLCEKPLTPDPDELEAVIAARDECRRIVSMTYPRRFDASIRAMRREILSGACGGVRLMTLYNAEDWITPNLRSWRHDPEICPGGFFYDASGHQIDTALWAAGLAPVWVRARTHSRGMPVPITAWGEAELRGGVPLTFAFEGAAQRWREQINIHCERAGFAMLDGRAYQVEAGELRLLAPESEDDTADAAFIRLLRGDACNWSPLEEVWPVLRFTRAGLMSAAAGGAPVACS